MRQYPVRMAIIKKQETASTGEVVEKLEPYYTADRNAKWYSLPLKREQRFLKKLKVEQPYDPAIQLLGIYPKELKSRS